MQCVKKFVSALEKLLPDNTVIPQKIRIFRDTDGSWRFRTLDNVQTWGHYGSYADARRTAESYNCFEIVDDTEDAKRPPSRQSQRRCPFAATGSGTSRATSSCSR